MSPAWHRVLTGAAGLNVDRTTSMTLASQKVVAIIKGDNAKTKIYCDIKKFGRQMERAYEKRDIKLTNELSHKIESLEKTLGPEYVALVDRLGALGPTRPILT
jgi:hypothetical protein